MFANTVSRTVWFQNHGVVVISKLYRHQLGNLITENWLNINFDNDKHIYIFIFHLYLPNHIYLWLRAMHGIASNCAL